jgi:hypothetical protein
LQAPKNCFRKFNSSAIDSGRCGKFDGYIYYKFIDTYYEDISFKENRGDFIGGTTADEWR